MSTASETILALEKALEAGPDPITTDLYGDRYFMGDYSSAQLSSAQDAFFTACSPLAIRTLLDAHASALADSKRLDWLLANPNVVCEDAGSEWFTLDADSEPTYFKSGREAIDAARALDDNTKGAR